MPVDIVTYHSNFGRTGVCVCEFCVRVAGWVDGWVRGWVWGGWVKGGVVVIRTTKLNARRPARPHPDWGSGSLVLALSFWQQVREGSGLLAQRPERQRRGTTTPQGSAGSADPFDTF